MYRECPAGHTRHWGPDGAAGALCWTRGRDGKLYVLLAKRSAHVQQGNTWAFPGGAIDQGESLIQAAIRELTEEVTGVPRLRIRGCASLSAPCPHGCGWAYTTFVVEAEPLAESDSYYGRTANVPRVAVAAGHSAWETDCVAWVPVGYVESLELHPAFAQAWPALREIIGEAAR